MASAKKILSSSTVFIIDNNKKDFLKATKL